MKPLSKQQLETLNRAVRGNALQFTSGRSVTEELQAGLISVDGKVVYRIDDGIPILLADEGIGTTQLQDFPRG